MATPPKNTDRRVQKTRNLIRNASLEVMKEKGFSTMTIQDITDRANINRGTFYAHYTDKFELLQELIRENFQRVLSSKLPPVSEWNDSTPYLLILTVLEYYEEEYRQCDPQEIVDPLVEWATKEELYELLQSWLQQIANKGSVLKVPVETIARATSWAILGAASHWAQDAAKLSSRQAAHEVLLVVMGGLASLVPGITAPSDMDLANG